MTHHDETEAQRLREERDRAIKRAEFAERSNDDLARHITELSVEVQRVTAERDQALRERDQARIAACALYSDNAPGTCIQFKEMKK